MNLAFTNLANAAAKYAIEHGLVVPDVTMLRRNETKWINAVSQAVEHAASNPSNKYAKPLLVADRKFAETTSTL